MVLIVTKVVSIGYHSLNCFTYAFRLILNRGKRCFERRFVHRIRKPSNTPMAVQTAPHNIPLKINFSRRSSAIASLTFLAPLTFLAIAMLLKLRLGFDLLYLLIIRRTSG